ncbi:MAG: cytochrome C [Desulfuromonadales bacterium]|nr:cytochrome C [Desulfuromonadales bacterium]
MKSGSISVLLLTALCATPLWGAVAPQGVTNMGNVLGGDFQAAHGVIEQKCTKCHSGTIIDAAISANKDMHKIQQEMEKKGVKLNSGERDVLGIYWKELNPLKKSK